MLSLHAAQTVVSSALAHCRKENFQPMAVVVLDSRGTIKAAAVEDGASLKRFEVAHGKAYGALALGMGSRSIFKRAKEQAFFVAAASHVSGGAFVPVPGGVLVRGGKGEIVGAVGLSGDTSDNDEAAACAAIPAAGFHADPGAD